MSVSYKDLKDKSYLKSTRSFVESRLGIHFVQSRAHCPFHDDSNPSLTSGISRID
jgi:hypothetical protein